jgi:hypothetical protein
MISTRRTKTLEEREGRLQQVERSPVLMDW